MWRRLFDILLPDTENLLPAPVQEIARGRIHRYWMGYGWQLVLGEVILWAAAVFQELEPTWAYALLVVLVTVMYTLGFWRRRTMLWLAASVLLLLIHGMLVNSLGAVTALTFIVPYTIAGMLLNGRRRVVIQTGCLLAFWSSLTYGVLPIFPQLRPPNYIVISYDIILAVFTFQYLRFLSQLAVEINSAYITAEIRDQSQQFLARVSHELRTPLNSVLGFAKLVKHTPLTERQTEYVRQIIDEGEHLNRLVSDLLDSARLTTGKLTLNLETCDVNALCVSAADEHRPTLSGTVALRLNLSPDLPSIQADPVRLRQAIANLVSNAVKYTERGEITITTEHSGEELHISVRDTGKGIPEAQQALVFVPFVQLDPKQLGVGLGLDIASQLVKLHGGDIHLSSQATEAGGGSTFTITLPIRSAPAAQAKPPN